MRVSTILVKKIIEDSSNELIAPEIKIDFGVCDGTWYHNLSPVQIKLVQDLARDLLEARQTDVDILPDIHALEKAVDALVRVVHRTDHRWSRWGPWIIGALIIAFFFWLAR